MWGGYRGLTNFTLQGSIPAPHLCRQALPRLPCRSPPLGPASSATNIVSQVVQPYQERVRLEPGAGDGGDEPRDRIEDFSWQERAKGVGTTCSLKPMDWLSIANAAKRQETP